MVMNRVIDANELANQGRRLNLLDDAYVSMCRVRRAWIPVLLAFLCCFEYRVLARTSGTFSFVLVEIFALISYIFFVLDGVIFFDQPRYLRRALPPGGETLFWYFTIAGVAAFGGLLMFGNYSLARWKDLLPAGLMFLAITMWTWDVKTLRFIVAAYLFGVACNVVLGGAQAVMGGPYPVELGVTALNKLDLQGAVIRANLATGFFSHPNSLAMLLVPSVILLFGWGTMSRSAVNIRLLSFVILLGALFVLYKTYSKGAYAWAAWGILFLIAVRITKVYGASSWMAAVTFSVVFVGAVSLWRSYDIAGLGTMRGRWNQWVSTVGVFQDHPGILIWGNGSNDLSWKSLLSNHMSYTYPNAHMWWLNQILMYGVVPFILLLTGIWKVMNYACEKFTASHPWTPERLVIGSAILALLGVYSFEPVIEGTTLQCQFFLLLAIFAKYGALIETKKENL